MKYLIYLLSAYCLIGCGNNKERIVEIIKKTKNEWYQAEMNRGAFNSAATKLLIYNNSLSDSKGNRVSDQMEGIVKINKDAYEASIRQLKLIVPDVSPALLKDQNKLDSFARLYEVKTWDIKLKLDSLELELKKY